MHHHKLFGATPEETLANVATLWLHMFPHEYVRYLVAAALAYILIHRLFAGLLAGRKIRPARPPAGQMMREFWTSTRTAGVFAFSGLLTVGGVEAGLIHIYSPPGERGWLYFTFTVVALIVLHDAWFYWTHRLIHDPRLFRRLHRTHHKSMNPSPWTAYSFDVGEAVINALYTPLALMLFPTSGLAILIFLTHMIMRNVIGHSGYELFPATRGGRPLIPFLTTVTHHDLHHAQAGWNYGLYFTWWDRLMGTEHPQYAERFAAAVRKPLDGSAVAALSPREGGAL